MPTLLTALLQIGFLAVFALACDWLASLGGLPVPGNVLGIVILFVLLDLGVVRTEHISAGAGFLLRHLVFFFVPFAVGLMNFGDLFLEHGLLLVAAVLLATVIPIFVVVFLALRLGAGKS